MEDAVVRRIKKTVAGNFDRSYERYHTFEKKHGFFAALTLRLAAMAGLQRGARVLDIGCGSGASSAALSREMDCRVTGFDLSPGMIEFGQRKLSDERVELKVGDAADPQACVGEEKFAAALYNASIFIIPDIELSLSAMRNCLNPGGVIAFSFFPMIKGTDGRDLFLESFDRCGLPRPRKQVVTSYETALAGLQNCCPETWESSWEMPFSAAFLEDLFAIPAQSFSLFPRLEYEERIKLLPGLFAALGPEAAKAKIVWRLAAGRI